MYTVRLKDVIFRQLSTKAAPEAAAKKKRTRRLFDGPIPSLEDFIFQRKVFKLYRNIVRVAYPPNKNMTRELLSYAKGEFMVLKNITDKNERRYILATGQNQFRDMCKSIGFAFPIKYTLD